MVWVAKRQTTNVVMYVLFILRCNVVVRPHNAAYYVISFKFLILCVCMYSGCYSDGAIRIRETTLLIRQLIEKDFKQRLTAAQTLDIVLNRLSRL